MKSRYDFPDDINAIEYGGDVIPRTDVDPYYKAEWIDGIVDTTEEQLDEREFGSLGAHAVEGVVFVDFPLTAEAEVLDSELPIPSWQRDVITRANLGIDQFDFQDYRALSAGDYDTWQRILRNYVTSLKNHAGRIRNVEGQVDLDYGLADLYGEANTPQELLQYAAQLVEAIDEIREKELVDHTFDSEISSIKLRNAPHFETVRVVRGSDDKMHLRVEEMVKDKTA